MAEVWADRISSLIAAVVFGGLATLLVAGISWVITGDGTRLGLGVFAGWVITDLYKDLRRG